MTLDPIFPFSWVLLLAVGAVGLTLLAHRLPGKRLGKFRNGTLTLFRLLAVLGIVTLLLRPSREESLTPPSVERTLLVAVDTSGSMKEADQDGVPRIDHARKALREAKLFDEENSSVTFFEFSNGAHFSSPAEIQAASANGIETHFHSSFRKMMRSFGGPPPVALLVLSDGHDLESISPGQTAKLASARDCPIYAVPFGAQGSARDVSIRATTFHPYTFRKQVTNLQATIRALGCQNETLIVDLIREGEQITQKRIETGTQPYHDVEFAVNEEDPGQFEYSIRVRQVTGEVSVENNMAVTYLNVLDEKIKALLIEGDPYWDTTFLRRSLARNDKLDVDALVRFTPNRTRAIRSNENRKDEPLDTPSTAKDFSPYRVVILGKSVETVLGEEGIAALEEWVDKEAGVVIFSRGRAWGGTAKSDLEPIDWSADQTSASRVEVTQQGLSMAPFRMLHSRSDAAELPPILAYEPIGKPKTLAAAYGQTSTDDPAIVYRRLGSGQTLSLGVANLWNWVFNAKTEFDNNLYDLFWDQLLLWLLANDGITPGSDYALQTNTANLPLGEEMTFSLLYNGKTPLSAAPTVQLRHNGAEAAILSLNPDPSGDSASLNFTPRAAGRYEAVTTLPGGKELQVRFLVFREQLERTETATDLAYLQQLATASGGRLIEPDEISELVSNLLLETAPMEARTRLVPLWNTALICLALVFLLAAEWFLRRRWGLT
ncbi:VWA domain-containing protein [Roseibacillus persicicus]|uniref:Membrane protein n=1 Tax=Roseibacillus persicicus TaxID=454148 RepID=A0A918WFE9_9BACT|nr:VWA domain-containing protein [Roseibacillus persicicus]GHC40620.1 membrane protein [Roseibacillus persicicus]